MSASIETALNVLPCRTCLLYRPSWQGMAPEDGFCTWFLSKLQVPKPIPAHVARVGCNKWRAKPAKPQQQEA